VLSHAIIGHVLRKLGARQPDTKDEIAVMPPLKKLAE